MSGNDNPVKPIEMDDPEQTEFESDDVLANSIKDVGLINPIVACKQHRKVVSGNRRKHVMDYNHIDYSDSDIKEVDIDDFAAKHGISHDVAHDLFALHANLQRRIGPEERRRVIEELAEDLVARGEKNLANRISKLTGLSVYRVLEMLPEQFKGKELIELQNYYQAKKESQAPGNGHAGSPPLTGASASAAAPVPAPETGEEDDESRRLEEARRMWAEWKKEELKDESVDDEPAEELLAVEIPRGVKSMLEKVGACVDASPAKVFTDFLKNCEPYEDDDERLEVKFTTSQQKTEYWRLRRDNKLVPTLVNYLQSIIQDFEPSEHVYP